MKKYILYISILCLCLNVSAQTYPKKANTIRLLTYNTHYCKGGTDPGSINNFNIQRLALVLKVLDADIVALQELDSAANSRGKRFLLGEIAKSTGLPYTVVYGNAADYDGGSIGCGTLVKNDIPIIKIKKLSLPSNTEARIVVRTDFDKFVFMSSHFDLDDDKRIQGAGMICNDLDYISKPVFLAGDLNDSFRWGGGAFANYLNDAFTIASSTEGSSLPGRTDGTQSLVDYVLLHDKNNSGIKVIDTHIVKSLEINNSIVDLSDISDHYPVFVDIEVPGLTNIANTMKENSFQVYPNPADGLLNLSSPQEINKIEVYSLAGQKVMELSGEYINNIDLSTLERGIYIIKAFSENKCFVKKITKK